MKKLGRFILSLILVVLSVTLLVSCAEKEDPKVDPEYTWSEYVSIADKTEYYDGTAKVLGFQTIKSLPQGYKVVADGANSGTEIGDYVIKYNVVKTEDSSVVYTIQATLHIIELKYVDYAGQVKLSSSSGRVQQAVTVKTFVDGDTTHFNVPDSVVEGGVLKARYIAINTPESTGKIEPYGKAASNFTKSKLSSATSIVVESDTNEWNADSTGGRYLVWVWYKSEGSDEYRNLNIEILQEGLAIASNTAQNSYGTQAQAALDQAHVMKKNLYSGEPDPLFYYGTGINVSIRDISLNPEAYAGVTVIFDANVFKDYNSGVYVEDYDEDTQQYYGMYLYYGFNAVAGLLEALQPGNRIHIVGTLQKYETAGTWQVSGLQYRIMNKNADDSTHILGEPGSYTAEYREVTVEQIKNEKVTLPIFVYDEELEETNVVDQEFSFAQIACYTSISVKNLKVVSTYTTESETSSNGAVSITCEDANGLRITVRTNPIKDASGNLVTEDAYTNKNISVKGVIEYYNGSYQVRVYKFSDITFNE